jgi:outer membrane protein TolC
LWRCGASEGEHMKRRSFQLQATVLGACVFAICSVAAAQARLGGGAPDANAAGVPVHLLALEAGAKSARPWQRSRDARLQNARARIDAARAAYSPTLNLVTDASVGPGARIVDIDGYKVSAAFPLGTNGAFKPAARYGAMLDARGNIYDFGRTRAAVDAAEAEARADQADLRNAELQTVNDVRAGYLRWATAYALWSISQRAEQAATETLERTRAAIEEGARRSADLTAAQSGAGFAGLELERALSELESARDDLGYVATTDFAETAYPVDDVLNVQDMPALVPEQTQQARLQALREQRTAAEASARAHDHAFTPVLSANAQAGVQGLNESFFPVYRIGVSLLVPLWDGGTEAATRAQALARGAQLGVQAAELERAEVRAGKRSQTLQHQAERRIGVADKLVNTCRTRVSQLEAAAPLGAASYAELADARSALSRAETELVLARALRAQVMLGLD